MTLDIKARATALRLIAKFGKSVAYTTVSAGTYNPATGSVVSTGSTSTVKAVIEDYKLYGEAFTAGLIRAGDRKITFAASGIAFNPKTGDKVTFDGDVYEVLDVTPTYSGEQIALYAVHGRK